MGLDNFFELLRTLPLSDKVVRLRYKWFEGDDWEYENVLLVYNGNTDDYEWEYDWDEGQKYVEVVGFLALELIRIPEVFL